MAFPEDRLDLRAELEISGARVDVTSRVFTRDPITIVSGMSAEGTQVDPSSCSLTLNNKDGEFSPRNPLGPHYGRLGRNTPLQISVPSVDSYLDLDGDPVNLAITPDHTALDITGDLDLRAEVEMDWAELDINQVLIAKWDNTGQRSYSLRIINNLAVIGWSADGVSGFSASASLPTLPARAAVRATLDVNNGAAGRTVRFFWATSLAGPWTQFGEAVQAGTTSVFASTAPLRIGSPDATTVPPRVPFRGRGYRFEVRSGINGTVVAHPDLRALLPGTTAFTDSAGRPWTLTGTASVRDREYLFTGEVSSWPARWSPSGQDIWTPIEAAGILRRLGQGRKALESTLRRRIPSDPDLVAYWPMEDGKDSTSAASPLRGVAPLTVSGLDFAADDSLGGSSPLPRVVAPASLRGTVPRSSSSGWQVEFVYFLPAMPVAQTEILRVTVARSPMRQAIVYASTAGIRIEARDEEGTVIAAHSATGADAIADFWGKWNRLAIYTGPTAGGFRFFASWRDITANSWWTMAITVTESTQQGAVIGVAGSWGAAAADMTLGHIAVFDTPATDDATSARPGSAIFNGADDGFAGETVLSRLARLAGEEPSVPVAWIDGDMTRSSARMGPQRPAVLTDLITQCAEADGGILSERPDRLGLLYRDLASLENQEPTLVLDYAAGHVAPPLEPVEDDQSVRNDITVTRDGGSSGRVVIEEGPLSVLPPEQGGVGIYDEALTRNVWADAQCVQIAGWLAHLGTWDEARYPSVKILLHQHPQLIPAVLQLRIGDKVRILGLPLYSGGAGQPVDLHVQQITHVPQPRSWEVTLVCAPAGPWAVGVEGAARADTIGSQLAAGVSPTATTLSVTTATGPRWMTSAAYPADFPFTIRAGGEVMSVTAITGTGNTQTFTVVRSINGISKPHGAGTDVRLAEPAIVAL
ncbi:hypothetical protein [Streptomyces sp. NPDC001889]